MKRLWIVLIGALLLTVTLAGCDDDDDPPPNQAPTASFTITAGRHIGDSISFTSTSQDSDGSIISYYWELGTTTTTAASFDHIYYTTGTFAVKLTVTDDDGATASKQQSITITNNAPTVTITGPTTVDKNQYADFSSTATDPDGDDISSVLWDFGNGQTSTAESMSVVYEDSGTYDVTFKAKDEWDLWSPVETITVTVENNAPVAQAGADVTVEVGDQIDFDGAASSDPDGDPLDYSWDFGNGDTATGEAPSYTYTTDGTYTVTLTVDDGDGGTDTDTLTVTVEIPPQPPVADAGDNQSIYIWDGPVYFDGTGSYDPDGNDDNLTYLWDFGDGDNAMGPQVEHTYTENGDYYVILTVTDDQGLTATDTCFIEALF